MRERERVAVDEVRRDVGLVDLLLLGVGQQHHDDVGLAHRVGGRQHAQPGRLGLRLRLRTRAQADDDVDARVLQVQRVRVTLRAVAEDRDQLVGDQAEIGVVLVVHGCGHRTESPRVGSGLRGDRPIVSPMAAGNGNQPRAVLTERSRVDSRASFGSAMRPVRCSSTMPNGLTRSLNASSFSGSPTTMIVIAS